VSFRRSDSDSRTAIPPWIYRLIGVIVATLVGLWAVYNVTRQLRSLLIMLAISLFLSIALEPGVKYLHAHGWKRGVATGFMFLMMIVAASMFIGLMIPLIVDQAVRLVDRIPGYIADISELAARFGIDLSPARASEALGGIDRTLQSLASDVAGSVFGVGQTLLNTIFQMLTIGLFTFYMTAEGPKFRRTVCSVLPPDKQREVLRVWDIAIDKTGGYFYSRALLAGFSAAIGWAAFSVIGIPFALALALWMGVLSQFVPVVGTYIGGALPLLIALLESPTRAIAVAVYVLVYQQLENYLLAPKITEKTMSLHPAVSFGSAIAGATLMGAPGALMALPTAATVQAFVSTYIARHQVVESELTYQTDEHPPIRPRDIDEAT
jgi:predicted PurR-regulated permease PerM